MLVWDPFGIPYIDRTSDCHPNNRNSLPLCPNVMTLCCSESEPGKKKAKKKVAKKKKKVAKKKVVDEKTKALNMLKFFTKL